MTSPASTSRELERGLIEICLDRPKANIVDASMIASLETSFMAYEDDTNLKAVLLTATGPNFSFGASVEEHLPGQCDDMLRGMHALVLRIVEYPVPVLVSIRGQCLGGGLEIASAGHVLFASPNAQLGQPEIKLAVIAPAASCLLPEKIGQARAEELLLSGRSMSADEAVSTGLVTGINDDPDAAARDWFETNLSGLSAAAIRVATLAVRGAFAARIRNRIAEVETLYLEKLMATRDAAEGLQAFIDKREPEWENC